MMARDGFCVAKKKEIQFSDQKYWVKNLGGLSWSIVSPIDGKKGDICWFV